MLLDWWVARKLPRRLLQALIAIALVGMLAIGIRETSQSSTPLRAAERESRAFSAAVLADHPVLAPGTVHANDGMFFVPVIVGIVAWLGLYLRDRELRVLVPLVAD